MTDRDRLIELIRQGKDMTPCEKDNDYRCEGIKCADCESKSIADYLLANGVEVLPIPIGTKVYEIRARGRRQIMWSSRKCDYGIVNDNYFENAKAHELEFYVREKSFVKSDCARFNKTIFETEKRAQKEIEWRLKNDR